MFRDAEKLYCFILPKSLGDFMLLYVKFYPREPYSMTIYYQEERAFGPFNEVQGSMAKPASPNPSEIHNDTKYSTSKGTLFRFFTMLEGFFEFYYSHMNPINRFVTQQIR